MTFLEWLAAPEGTPAPWRENLSPRIGDEGRPDLRRAATPPPTREPKRSDREGQPIPAMGSAAYHQANLGRKFWIATSIRLPQAMPLQRELQRTIRTPGFDPWQAAETLRQIETIAREVGA